MRLYDFISYEALEFWFSDMDENLEKDISAVHVLCILYSKDRYLDFSVDVFGGNGIEDLPVYSEVVPVDSGKVSSPKPIHLHLWLPCSISGFYSFFQTKGCLFFEIQHGLPVQK